ncbi:GerMN domain-containing protein [Actinomyces minihominis]|uniref:GerMN domain-containing protein n=1 Tax=Actinomyces minihominis TaxID=2002838 RepID=UPI00101AE095|nr:GerMN domain-containing protein [Actinomyces minihominis]
MRRVPRVFLALLAACAVMLPAACSAIPTSGALHEFDIEAPQRDPIHQFGSAPQQGSTPRILVEDFLRACAAGIYDDFATARLYLTPEVASTWQPNQQVAVFPSDFTPRPELKTEDDETEVVLALTTMGTINASGVLSATAGHGSSQAEFTLVQNEEGEWRIAALEDGLILSESAFNSAYQSVNLLFPSEDLSALSPDPRWYPRTRISSYLMQGLLDGPSEALAPAVVGDLGAELKLPTAGVEVHDRVAQVNLEGTPPNSELERNALIWEILSTLTQIPSVQDVEIRINGVVQDESNLPRGPRYRLDRLVGVEDGAVVMGSTATSGVYIPAETAGKDAQNPTIGPVESSSVAWVSPETNTLSIMAVNASEPRRFEIKGPTAPSVDRFGTVWVASPELEGAVWAVPSGGEPIQVPIPFDGEAVKIRVSPDGSRALLLTRGAGGAQVTIATVHRGAAGTGQVTLQSPNTISLFSPEVVDLTWVGETTIAALIPGSQEGSALQLYGVGGWMQVIAAPPEISRVTGAGMLGSLLVQREDGTTFQRAGAAWIELTGDVLQVSFAG